MVVLILFIIKFTTIGNALGLPLQVTFESFNTVSDLRIDRKSFLLQKNLIFCYLEIMIHAVSHINAKDFSFVKADIVMSCFFLATTSLSIQLRFLSPILGV